MITSTPGGYWGARATRNDEAPGKRAKRAKRYDALSEHLRVLRGAQVDLARKCRAAGIGTSFVNEADVVRAARAADLPEDLRAELDALDHGALTLAARHLPRIERIAAMHERRYGLGPGDLFDATMNGFMRIACTFEDPVGDFSWKSGCYMHSAAKRTAIRILRARSVEAPVVDLPTAGAEDLLISAESGEIIRTGLRDLLRGLSPRHQYVVGRRTGLDTADGVGETFAQIGVSLGVSRTRVWMLWCEAIGKCTDALRRAPIV